MTNPYHQLVEIMLGDDDASLDEFILQESEKDDVMLSLDGNSTLMNYMMLFEEFLDNHDLYLFKGWEKAVFVKPPMIEKFWAVFWLQVGPETDLDGARRIHDAVPQGEVAFHKQSDGTTVVKFTILKRALDQIEVDTRTKIEKLATDGAEDVS